MNPLFLVDTFYNGNKHLITMKLFDPQTQEIVFHDDNTGHLPYCLTNLSIEELSSISRLSTFGGLDHLEPIEKIDPLSNQRWSMTKIVARDPLSIGGSRGLDVRTILPESNPAAKVWESNIKYYQSYIYDRNLRMGLPYTLQDGLLTSFEDVESERRVQKVMALFPDLTNEERIIIRFNRC